jgi:hypothetical protein
MVILAGQVISGAALSSTKMTWIQVVELPHSSSAIQVLLSVNSCGHVPGKLISEKVIVGVRSQLSVAVAVPVAGGNVLSEHEMVRFGGQVNSGPALSSTKMTCTQEAELPQSSAANQVLLIVYSCGQPPATVTSEEVIVGVPSQLSVAVAVPVFAGNVLSVQSTVMFAGQVIAGPASSVTSMTWVQEAEFPQSSVAVHVLLIVYC